MGYLTRNEMVLGVFSKKTTLNIRKPRKLLGDVMTNSLSVFTQSNLFRELMNDKKQRNKETKKSLYKFNYFKY